MTISEHAEAFGKGEEHARAAIGVELMEMYCADKIALIKRIFQNVPNRTTDPLMQGYSEGLRHALSILGYRGDAIEAYRNITNNQVPLDIDKMPELYEGH